MRIDIGDTTSMPEDYTTFEILKMLGILFVFACAWVLAVGFA